MDRAGVVGVRWRASRRPGRQAHRLRAIHELGWSNISSSAARSKIAQWRDAIWARRARFVLDHMGNPAAGQRARQPEFAFVRAVSTPGVAGRSSAAPIEQETFPRRHDPVHPRAGGGYPTRLLWGSDWPHRIHQADGPTTRADRSDRRWIPDAATRQKIFVDNPASCAAGL